MTTTALGSAPSSLKHSLVAWLWFGLLASRLSHQLGIVADESVKVPFEKLATSMHAAKNLMQTASSRNAYMLDLDRALDKAIGIELLIALCVFSSPLHTASD